MSTNRRLRIAQVAPPHEPVPPSGYGGTERVIHELVCQLTGRGHEVTTFASADSVVPGRLIPTVPRALRPAGHDGDDVHEMMTTVASVAERADEFDVVHSHLEWWSVLLARLLPIPVVATFHGRLDSPGAETRLATIGGGLVAISRQQASVHPTLPWRVVHNGLTLAGEAAGPIARTQEICFVGRLDAEKGALAALEVAKLSGRRVRIAAKIGPLGWQRQHYEEVFLPALRAAGSAAEYLGEIGWEERDRLMAESHATIMPGAWPEPFGLVAIESLARGTPVVARRVGGLPEIVREGRDGYFGDDAVQMAYQLERVGALDRGEMRRSVLDRFSAERMADGYEAVYARVLAAAPHRYPQRRRVRWTPVDANAADAAVLGPAQAVRQVGNGDGQDGGIALR